MSDFVFDNLPSVATKTDAHAPVVPSQEIDAADVNQLSGQDVSLRTAITAGKWHGLASNPSAPLSASGSVSLRSNAGALELSQNAGAYQTLADAVGAVSALASVGSSPAAAGASISSHTLTLQPADATHPGVLTSGSQTVGGLKTFAAGLALSAAQSITFGDASVQSTEGVTALAAVGSTPDPNAASIVTGTLTLQPADATHPGVMTAAAQTFGGTKTGTQWVAADSGGGIFTIKDTTGSANQTLWRMALNAGQGYLALQTLLDNGSLQTSPFVMYRTGLVYIGQSDSGSPSPNTSYKLNVGGDILASNKVASGSSTNNWAVSGSTTGNPITFAASGGDSAIDIQVTPKGTGKVVIPTLNLTNALGIAYGGTGATTQQAALDAIAGAVTSARVLRGDGTHVTLAALQAGDVPTLNQNTSGSAASLSATLAIASGGTGQVTANAALNALLPAQTTANGKVLQSNGTDTSWQTASGGITTVGTFSASSQTNGATISGSTITFGIADSSHPGMVSTGADSWTGNKILTGGGIFGVTVSNAVGVSVSNGVDATINLRTTGTANKAQITTDSSGRWFTLASDNGTDVATIKGGKFMLGTTTNDGVNMLQVTGTTALSSTLTVAANHIVASSGDLQATGHIAANQGRSPNSWPVEAWTSSGVPTLALGAANTTMICVNNDTAYTSNPEAGIGLLGRVTATTAWVGFGAVTAAKENATISNNAAFLRFCSSTASAVTEGMRLNSSQNLLINVTADDSTGAKLQCAGKVSFAGSYTNNAASPGNTTISKASGRAAIASSASAVTVTNTLVSATSIVYVQCETSGTAVGTLQCVPGAGSFVVTNLVAGAATNVTGATTFSFVVFS